MSKFDPDWIGKNVIFKDVEEPDGITLELIEEIFHKEKKFVPTKPKLPVDGVEKPVVDKPVMIFTRGEKLDKLTMGLKRLR